MPGVRLTFPAGDDGHNMIDMERGFLTELREPTILTPVSRSQDHRPPEPAGNSTHFPLDRRETARPARSQSKESISARSTSPCASLRSAAVRRRPLSWRSSNSCNRAFHTRR